MNCTPTRGPRTPRRLFSFSPGSALALGVAATHAYEPVTGLIRELTGVSRYEPFALLPLGFVLGAGLTLAIWRAELAAHVTGGRWEHTDRVGRSFGMGLALGAVGSPSYAASIGSALEASPLTMGTASFVLGAGGYLAVRWIAGAARAWAPVVAAGRRRGLVVHGTVLCTVVLLTTWLAFLLQLAPWSVTLASSKYLGGLSDPVRLVVGGVYYLMAVQPFVLTLLLLMTALVPLLGAVAARRTGVRAPEHGPGTALRTALWTSGVAAALWWSVHVYSALFAPGLLPRDPYVYGLVGACLAQVVVALIAERRTRAAARELSPLHGILAAAVAGAVLHPTLVLAHDHSRCLRFGFGSENCHVLPWAAEWTLLAMPYSWGLIAASLAVLLRVGLIRRSRRPKHAAPAA
ncbi:hypothetical protein [Streptomyces sp. NPDC090445]|uniref:hypothetical protein n=1 Tax=Streptomyces sp. NPDC090445 TaxID=3365963 RepID=UPI0037F5B3B6